MRFRASQSLALISLAALAAVACTSGPPPYVPPEGGGGIAVITGGTGGGGDPGGGQGGTGGTGGGGGQTPDPSFEIHAIHPGYGTTEGRTRVTITGAGFVTSVPGEAFGASTVVLFGNNPSVEVRVVDDGTILATTPVGLVGTADVIVRNSSGEAVCEACFQYLPPLKLEALEPSAAPLEGGSRIALRGEGLDEDTTVLFGARAALLPERTEDGSLLVTLPPGDAPGLVDVRVYSASRQSILRRAFRYLPPLRVDGIEPPSSPLEGGRSVVLFGEGFSPASRVLFGGVEAEVQLGDEGLVAEVPPGSAAGPVEVEVIEGGSRFSFPFAYIDPLDDELALFAVAPAHGPAEGDQEVTILGSGFDQEGPALYFGEALAPDLWVESPNVMRARTPPGGEGAVEVRVRTVEAMRSRDGAFRYLPPLELHEIEPRSGPTEGGTRIHLRGKGFPENPRVFVGALEAEQVKRIDSGHIEALTPPGTDGVVSIRVLDAEAPGHQTSLAEAFAYEGPLGLAVAEPPTGARAGGTRVVLRGRGFREELRVFFGEQEAESLRILDSHTLEVFSPRGEVGLVDLRVVRSDGAEAMLEGGFYYFNPASTSGGASGGPLQGVLNVTAIARSGPHRNLPIEGCMVRAGADDSTLITKRTDDRGQATLSSPSLVKAVNLTVSCEDYELATMVNQVSENITVLLRFTGTYPPIEEEEEEEEEEDEEDTRPPGISAVIARVYGFKPPVTRTLAPGEELLARLSIAHQSASTLPPFGSQMPTVELRNEGEPFAFRFWGSAYLTLYAVYGIHNTVTGSFQPLLLGFARGISAVEHETVEVDLILDNHLDRKIPVTLPEPIWYSPGSVEVRAFMELGSDGIIPLGSARNWGAVNEVILTGMPRLSGENLLFQVWSTDEGERPWSLTYLRQGGDPTRGIEVEGLLAPLTFVEPPEVFDGLLEWELPPSGLYPDVIHIEVFDTGTGKPLWHAVLAGNERRIRIPEAVLDELRERSSGAPWRVDLKAGSRVAFDFSGWDYRGLALGNFASFTVDRATIRH